MDAAQFVKQFQNLYLKNPQISHWTRQSENCDYGDIIVVSKNCYLCFSSSNLENCFYSHDSRKSRDCGDIMFCEESELCYECIDCAKCYNGNFLQDCKQCTDCSYCYGCIGCSNCFGCAGLQRKEFYIFNEPYSKEDYAAKVAELKRLPATEIEKRFEEVKRKSPRVFMHQMENENSFGDYLHHSKNCYWCFDSYLCEDSMYIFNANLERGTKDCLDCGPAVNTLERCYDIPYCGFMYDCNHCYWCDYLQDCEWCTNAWNLKNCFGCVYTQKKEFQLLNSPISKAEYEKTTKNLNKELAKMGVTDLYGLVNFKV